METENRYNLPKDTFEWLMEIGVIDISKFVYSAVEPRMLYSEDYLKNTPLEKLKAEYEQQLPQDTGKQPKNAAEELAVSIAEMIDKKIRPLREEVAELKEEVQQLMKLNDYLKEQKRNASSFIIE